MHILYYQITEDMLMKKNNSFLRTVLRCALIILLSRIVSILIFSFLAYLTSDPGANLLLFSAGCRIVSDMLCGLLTAKAVGKDFSASTRVFFALSAVIAISVIELLIGKLIFPGGDTAIYMIPISVLAAFLGAILQRGRSAGKRPKRKRR